MTPAQRALNGRIGAAIARSRHDPRELTANARHNFLARFEAQVRAETPDLPAAEVQRRATELKRAHMLSLSLRSSISREKKKSATPTKVTPLEDGHGPTKPLRPAA